jgi:hypothetical protein
LRKRRAVAAARDPALEQAMAWILGEKRSSGAVDAAADLPAEPTVRDLLAAAEEGRQATLAGRFLTLVGQCSPQAGGEGRRFDLYRMLVTCCVADAQVISIEVVNATAVEIELEHGQWIRVRGVIRFDGANGPALPVLHAADIEQIPLPSRPYL